MPTKARCSNDRSDLRIFQRFRGTLGYGENSFPVRFKARIQDDGEVELEIFAIRVTSRSAFVGRIWKSKPMETRQFTLNGIAEDGLRFESNGVVFTYLGERASGEKRHIWSKPRCEVWQANFVRPLNGLNITPALKLSLKGFECFRRLHQQCSLGDILAAGETKISDPDKLNGFLSVTASKPPDDADTWRAKAEELLEHVRRVLSLGSGTMLHAPVLEYVNGNETRVEILSQNTQNSPEMRVFHRLYLQPALDAAVASYFNPRANATDLFFAIEWLAMPSNYNEVRLVNAMTALENLIDTNLPEEESQILPQREFEKTRKALRQIIKKCLERWPQDKATSAQEALSDLNEKLSELNRRSLKRKFYRLAANWEVPLEGISEDQISQMIKVRNSIVHTGRHSKAEKAPDFWEHVTVVHELVVRFLLTALCYQGQYISHVGGYHLASFPPNLPSKSV